MKPKNIAVVYTKPRYTEHKLTFNIVKSVLKENKIKFKLVERSKLKKGVFKGSDFILIVGGDGTFLRASHYLDSKTPILGVNSNVMAKEGFFHKCNRKNFKKKFNSMIKKKSSFISVTRLEAKINSKNVADLALNEFYIGPVPSYHTHIYDLSVNSKKELQKSSGILVGTGSGSNAWIKSAGGKRMKMDSKKIQFVVREPISGRITESRMKKGFFTGKLQLKTKTKAVLVVDSVSKEYPLKPGSVVSIKISNKPLKFLAV